MSSLARLRPLDSRRRLQGPTDARLTKCQYKDTGHVTEFAVAKDPSFALDLAGPYYSSFCAMYVFVSGTYHRVVSRNRCQKS